MADFLRRYYFVFLPVALIALIVGFAVYSLYLVPRIDAQVHKPKASICFYTSLPNGPAKAESDSYCQNGRQLAWSMYAAAVKFANDTHTIVGYPEEVAQINDWGGRNNTMVFFSSGIRGEHYDDGVVRFYDAQSHLLFKCGNGCKL